MRFAFIAKNKGVLPINRLCEIMDVSPRGYRAYGDRPLSNSQRNDLIVLYQSGIGISYLRPVYLFETSAVFLKLMSKYQRSLV